MASRRLACIGTLVQQRLYTLEYTDSAVWAKIPTYQSWYAEAQRAFAEGREPEGLALLGRILAIDHETDIGQEPYGRRDVLARLCHAGASRPG